MNPPIIETAIRLHLDKYGKDGHESDCAICIAYHIGLQDSKPF